LPLRLADRCLLIGESRGESFMLNCVSGEGEGEGAMASELELMLELFVVDCGVVVGDVV
jgi:hypothetical protein